MHLQEVTHHASHLLLGMQFAETQTTRSEHFSTTATRKTAASTPNMLCPHTSSAMNHQLWLRQGHYQRPTQKLQVRKTRNKKSAKQEISNPESGIPPSNPHMIRMQPISLYERLLLLRLRPQRLGLFSKHGRRVMEHARHRLQGVLRLLQAVPGNLDNELVAACSPFDSRDAPDVVGFQLLGNLEELAGDLELVLGVKPHPRHMNVAQFACDQVLHCIRVLFVAVGNTPRSGPIVLALAVFALPAHPHKHTLSIYPSKTSPIVAWNVR